MFLFSAYKSHTPLPEAPAKCIPIWMSNWRIQALDITHRRALSVSDLPSPIRIHLTEF
jgi:hypothetical protein